MWAEAMTHLRFTSKTGLPSAALDGDTPFFRFLGRQAGLSHLRVFGSRAFVQYEEHARLQAQIQGLGGCVMVGILRHSPAYRV